MNRKNNTMKKTWKSAAIAVLSVLAIGMGAVGTFRVHAEDPITENQASVTINAGDTTEYATLEDAFQSLYKDHTGCATVTLLTDVVLTSSVSTPENERTVLDLNGKTISGGAVGFVGTDILKDSSEAGTGTIEENVFIHINAVLTVKGGHYYGSYPLYLDDNATAVVDGGSFYGHNDMLINDGSKLILKNAQFPAVNGEKGGFGIVDYSNEEKGYADFLDVSAAYYIGETKVEDTDVPGENEITSVKQQYVATYEQEGQPIVYITDAESIKNAIFSEDYYGDEAFISTDLSLPTKLTLYTDVYGGSNTQKLQDLTMDLNGNVLWDCTHRVNTTLRVVDGSTYQSGLLYSQSFMLDEDDQASSDVNVTLDCASCELHATIHYSGNFTIIGGKHYGDTACHVMKYATSAKMSLHGGTYESLLTYVSKQDNVQFSVKDVTVGHDDNDTERLSWDLGDSNYFPLVEALANGYTLQYTDGRYETEINTYRIFGSFSIVGHEHTYSVLAYNETQHWMECACGAKDETSVAGHDSNADVLSYDETAHWYACDGCEIRLTEETHDHELVPGTHTDENGTNEHLTVCTVCDHEVLAICTMTIVNQEPATETEMGSYTYQCNCGYEEVEAYCDHIGDLDYITVGTADDKTHTCVCLIDGCGAEFSETCSMEYVDYESATETAMGYYIYQCDCGYEEIDTYCDHLGEFDYTKVGTADNTTHERVCMIDGCDEVWTEDCVLERETVYPTLTEDGYYVYTCACGYTYEESVDDLKAYGDEVLVTIGGLEMTFNGGAYYVNGADGAVGTVHSEAPATYHARLTYEAVDDGEPIITLEINGLVLSVTSGSALVLEDGVDLTVIGENNITATYSENGTLIEMFGENMIASNGQDGTLNITLEGAKNTVVYAIDGRDLTIANTILNVTLNASGSAISVQEGVLVDNAIVNVSVATGEDIMRGIYAKNWMSVWQSDVNVEITCLVPDTDADAGTTSCMAFGLSSSELTFEQSNVHVVISNAYYACGISADGELNVMDSALSVETSGNGMVMGIAVHEGYDAGLCIEGSTVDVKMQNGLVGISVSSEGYTDYGVEIIHSKVNVEMSGENTMVYGMIVQYKPYIDSGAAMLIDHSTVTVDTSKAIGQINYGINAKLQEDEDGGFADAHVIYMKNSHVYTYYGAGIMTAGVSVDYNVFDDYHSANEVVYVRDSILHAEYKNAGDWDKETLEKYDPWENNAMLINASFDDSNKRRLVTFDDSSVTAIAGDGAMSAGLKIRIREACCESYIDEVLYAIDSNLTFVSGKGLLESAGLYLNADEDIYGYFGIQLIDCETLAISSEASYLWVDSDLYSGTAAAMWLEMDTSDELLYLEDGRTVLIAPDTYEVEEDGRTMMYNEYSYALIVRGDDAEIVSGTLEMWAGRYCVEGDLDIKNNLYPYASMSYDDTQLDNRFGTDIRFELEEEEDMPKYVFIGQNTVYVGGLAMSDGDYYVNGKHGVFGEVYSQEPETWHAKLDAVYDEHGEFIKYVLTLNGLHLTAQEDSLLFAQIWSLADLDIVLADGSENVVEANELAKAYAAYRTASAIDVRTFMILTVEDEESGATKNHGAVRKGGTVTVMGGGALTLVGMEQGVTHDGNLYVAMDSYFENGVYTLKDLNKKVEATKDAWTVQAHAHTASDWIIEKAATCTEAGSKHKTCTDCGAVLETAAIDAAGHSYGEWTVIQEATKESAGLRQKVCEHCGDKVTELIPEKKELSDGAIVGITLGSTAAGCSGIAVGLWFILKKRLLGVK